MKIPQKNHLQHTANHEDASGHNQRNALRLQSANMQEEPYVVFRRHDEMCQKGEYLYRRPAFIFNNILTHHLALQRGCTSIFHAFLSIVFIPWPGVPSAFVWNHFNVLVCFILVHHLHVDPASELHHIAVHVVLLPYRLWISPQASMIVSD